MSSSGCTRPIPPMPKPVMAVGIEGLKLAVQRMPGIPTFGYIGFVAWDQDYWTNWPGSENAYTQPYTHWGPFKYMTPLPGTDREVISTIDAIPRAGSDPPGGNVRRQMRQQSRNQP